MQCVSRQRNLIGDRFVAFFCPANEQIFVGIQLVANDRIAQVP